jgi:transposase-like protein
MKVKQPASINGKDQFMNKEPDPQVVPKAKRRQFSAQYKLRILEEADNCTERGEVGALLRREGLYSSHLTDWRRQRDRGALEGLRSQKRGRKPDPQAAEIARLQRENEQLSMRLERAEKIIDVQKKLAQLLGTTPAETLNSEAP